MIERPSQPPIEIPSVETSVERIPPKESVQELFESVIAGAFEELRCQEDEQGLYLWEVRVAEKFGPSVYTYMRKGHYSEGQASDTAIHVVYLDEDGIECGGKAIAKFVNGAWKRI